MKLDMETDLVGKKVCYFLITQVLTLHGAKKNKKKTTHTQKGRTPSVNLSFRRFSPPLSLLSSKYYFYC